MNNKSIPKDFPRSADLAALSGMHPKLAVRQDADSRLYITGPTNEELRERYELCADLVDQLVAKCRKNRETKYASMTENRVLASFFEQLTKTGWGTQAEMAWIIRHMALTLVWPPLDAAEKLLTPPP